MRVMQRHQNLMERRLREFNRQTATGLKVEVSSSLFEYALNFDYAEVDSCVLGSYCWKVGDIINTLRFGSCDHRFKLLDRWGRSFGECFWSHLDSIYHTKQVS